MDAPLTMTFDADDLQERFLASLRDRVAWQARQAERIRNAVPTATRLDVLQIDELRRLVDAEGDRPRTREWQSFLAELDVLADDDGRLPAQLERLVRVVLADLLP
jgi:hypothetical protein